VEQKWHMTCNMEIEITSFVAHGDLFIGKNQEIYYNILNIFNELSDWLSIQSRDNYATTFNVCQWTASRLRAGPRAIVCAAPLLPRLGLLL
jgi:hypothetical protein